MPSPDPFYTKPEEFVPLVKKGASITLDPAHALFSKVNPINFIKKFKNRIAEVHLQDATKSPSKEMLQLGTGDVDYLGVLNSLSEIDFKGCIIIEVNSEKAAIKSLDLIRKAGYL